MFEDWQQRFQAPLSNLVHDLQTMRQAPSDSQTICVLASSLALRCSTSLVPAVLSVLLVLSTPLVLMKQLAQKAQHPSCFASS